MLLPVVVGAAGQQRRSRASWDRRLVSLSGASGAAVSSRKPLSTGVAWGNAVHGLG
jgi:hypothetical protein